MSGPELKWSDPVGACRDCGKPARARYSYDDGSILDLCDPCLGERRAAGDRVRKADVVDWLFPGADGLERQALQKIGWGRRRG
jgi:hypothetical protein